MSFFRICGKFFSVFTPQINISDFVIDEWRMKDGDCCSLTPSFLPTVVKSCSVFSLHLDVSSNLVQKLLDSQTLRSLVKSMKQTLDPHWLSFHISPPPTCWHSPREAPACLRRTLVELSNGLRRDGALRALRAVGFPRLIHGSSRRPECVCVFACRKGRGVAIRRRYLSTHHGSQACV